MILKRIKLGTLIGTVGGASTADEPEGSSYREIKIYYKN